MQDMLQDAPSYSPITAKKTEIVTTRSEFVKRKSLKELLLDQDDNKVACYKMKVKKSKNWIQEEEDGEEFRTLYVSRF